MSYEFTPPEFVDGAEPEEIQQRMMDALPDGIDDMPGGFPYDFTMPTAIEKSELIQFHLVRTLMLMFPQYAWGNWLDLHAAAAGIERRPAGYASGSVTVTGDPGTVIPDGAIFCTEATDSTPALEYAADSMAIIPESGSVTVEVTAVEAGRESNTKKNTVVFALTSIKGLSTVNNPDDITGGTDVESDEDLLERIEEENFRDGATFIGNDSDYIRWAKEVVGVGDCIVVPTWNGPGTVKLIIVDSNGEPANARLIEAVYDHIVSPHDRSLRLLPTACAELTVEAATTKKISYTCTGLVYDDTTDIPTIVSQFKELVMKEYSEAKVEGILVYNQVRPLITDIPGVSDFDAFLMNGAEENIPLSNDEYAATDQVDFS
ncbi:baseplate J/gp47 family protein [Enterocloster sp.]|uniref:baseplate J/gp47 family protein n=1 Tax=Enterocloster sp. TaxID=2719315 RepID=UPI003077B03E